MNAKETTSTASKSTSKSLSTTPPKFVYTSLLHLYIVHIRYFMTMMHGRLDERHRRPLNLDHLKFVTVGTCKLNNIYNLEQMLMLGPEDIAALFLFRRALYVVRFRQAVRYMMQYHLLWAIKPKIRKKVMHIDKAIGKEQLLEENNN